MKLTLITFHTHNRNISKTEKRMALDMKFIGCGCRNKIFTFNLITTKVKCTPKNWRKSS